LKDSVLAGVSIQDANHYHRHGERTHGIETMFDARSHVANRILTQDFKLRKLMKTTLMVLSAALSACYAAAREIPATPVSPVAINRWQDARFGMFIHWGPVSIKGTEIGWSRGDGIPIQEYDNLYKQFNPVEFNADEWVATAKAAGMRYMILTAKHHDGFCLWDTKQTDHNIMNTPFKRDVVKELAAACNKGGIAFGTYYSTCDWHHPDFPLTSPGGGIARKSSNLDAYTEYLKSQTKELLTNYGPFIAMWYDVPQCFDATRGQSVINLARSIQPEIVINNRTGARGDFDTPEQKVGEFQIDRPWESCMTIGTQWSWKPNDKIKSLEECLHALIRTNGGGGNLLFNVGPMPTGRIEPLQVQRLKEMGDWLTKNGESLHGTRGGPYKPSQWLVSTRKTNQVYLHILKWATDSITLPSLPKVVTSSRSLTGGKVAVKVTADGMTLTMETKDRDPIDTIIELTLDGSAMEIQPVSQ
jgi:alpha-L-fucosidase